MSVAHLAKMQEPPTVEEFRLRFSKFGTYDYAVFGCILIVTALFGIYCAFRKKKDVDDGKEYLMGGRNMNVFPVASSLVASAIPGIVLLEIPAETYLYGTEYAFICITILLTGLISSYLVLPVFRDMKLISAHGYLELRFDRNVRFFVSLLFLVFQMCWLPVVVHVPAVALNQVTGMKIHILTPCVCFMCILYTCLGGLKAAVWADVLPIICMIGSMILVTIKGSLDAGGFEEVWQKNYEGGRLVVPTFEGDLTLRHTFWGICFGGLIMHLQGIVLNQNVLQRYMSLPTTSHSRRALWIVVFIMTALILICCYSGLIIYALYHDCDPLTTKLAKSRDQLLPLLVMKSLGDLPGIPGLLAAGIFGASLSSVSTGLNSISAVVLEDFVKPFTTKEVGGRVTCFILRVVVIFFGALFLCLVFNGEKFGNALQLVTSVATMMSGPVFGVFFSGLFLPLVNAKGALLGGVLGLFGSGFVIVGAQNAILRNKLRFISKPTSVEGCLYYYNATILESSSESTTETSLVFPLFKLSYLWYTAFGGFTTIILALMISAASGFPDVKTLDPRCFSPIIRYWLPAPKSQQQKYYFLSKQIKK